jgi:type IV pilus assembly protein PilX
MQRSPKRQRGIVLLVALTVLVAMSLAGVALMRSVDNTVVIAGNISFKQASLQVSDRGTRDGMAWLTTTNTANPTLLNSDNPSLGYFSARPPTEPDWFDPVTWANSVTTNGGLPDASGNTVSYVIHRMCALPGLDENADGQFCVKYYPPSQKLDSNSKAVGQTSYDANDQNFYRVTTRVAGPRNNVTVIQTSVLL